ALVCAPIVLAGCGNGWVKPGASQQDFGEDRSACLKEAQRPGGSVFVNPFTGVFGQESRTDSRVFNACMNEHGWSIAGQPTSN
ncbi:MAG: hypothetical protein ACREEA_12310, partial [Stellaceae bacterium]